MKNLERYKSDLAALIEAARKLELALLVKTEGIDKLAKAIGANDSRKNGLKNLPSFNTSYQAWYSECIPLIKQMLPDRLMDFRGHFDVPKGRKEITYATYRIHDALQGLQVTRPPYNDVVVNSSAAVPHFERQVAILKAVERRFVSSLFDIRQLVQADLLDDELDAARELRKRGFLRAAGAIAGVVLEKHLRQVCEDHTVKI